MSTLYDPGPGEARSIRSEEMMKDCERLLRAGVMMLNLGMSDVLSWQGERSGSSERPMLCLEPGRNGDACTPAISEQGLKAEARAWGGGARRGGAGGLIELRMS
mmetsp:Transcript_21445/g.48585  ORF Transcript_21445/g.48585 Transcript_21445/m.48585 type:complete len:104 (+) Transcript_21445:969-1280(+)